MITIMFTVGQSTVAGAMASWLARWTPGSRHSWGHYIVFLVKITNSHSASLHPGVIYELHAGGMGVTNDELTSRPDTVHTILEGFEHAVSLFLRLGLPSTLIRHEGIRTRLLCVFVRT